MVVLLYVLNEVGRKIFDSTQTRNIISSKKAGLYCWQCKYSTSAACTLPLSKLVQVKVTLYHFSFLVYCISSRCVAGSGFAYISLQRSVSVGNFNFDKKL
jgi:hypothetical protein